MSDILPFLKELISAPGLSGYETPVTRLIEAKWRPLVDELSLSRLGSLHGLRRGCAPEPRPSLLIAAHMDAVGLMVAGIVDGFLRLIPIGDIDPRILPGGLVIVHATGAGRQEDLPGVIAQPSARLLPPSAGDGPVPIEQLLVDVGLLPHRVAELVRPGDLVSFAQPPLELSAETLAGHSLDNRASLAALTFCLEELQPRPHDWDVWVVATIQEETGLVGAQTSAFQIRPDIAIAVDVGWAKGPGADGWNTFPLGGGPTLGWGANIHPALHNAFKELAERLKLPCAVEPMPKSSDTDAMAMQVAAEGIPTMVISIPLRYMHTPVEVVSIRDIQRTGRLLAEFVAGLEAEFMEKIVWENNA